VLEHIEDDKEFLQSLHFCLQPNGLLYITVPAYQSLWSIEDDQARHFRRYTVSSLTARLNECGFTVNYCSYFFSFLYPAILLCRSLPSRLGLQKSVRLDTNIKEHSDRDGLSRTIRDKFLGYELSRIKKQKSIPIGSSCVAVASIRGG